MYPINLILSSDCIKLAELEDEQLGPEALNSEEFRTFLFKKKEHVRKGYIIKDGKNNILSYILYKIIDDRLIIVRIFTDLFVRSQGLGKSLIDHIKKKVGPTIKKIQVAVPDSHLELCKYYTRFGFQVIKNEDGIALLEWQPTCQNAQ